MASYQPNADDYIWPGFPCVTFPGGGLNGIVQVEDSPRSGGGYTIDFVGRMRIQDRNLLLHHRALLTSMLIDLREQGEQWPQVTVDLINRAISAQPMSVDERAVRLLRFLAGSTTEIGKAYNIDRGMHQLLAWSESTSAGEVGYLVDYLINQEWLAGVAGAKARYGDYLVPSDIRVTVSGHRKVANESALVQSAQGFVAMWLGESIADVYESGIRPAIDDSGFKPMRIDQENFTERIEDRIIAEIRRSRFLVADFTHDARGARGSVYYEAGFAHGLGLDVIFTCQRDQVDELHFDTSHYPHITWTSPEDLRNQLTTRILAVIGEGPLTQSVQ